MDSGVTTTHRPGVQHLTTQLVVVVARAMLAEMPPQVLAEMAAPEFNQVSQAQLRITAVVVAAATTHKVAAQELAVLAVVAMEMRTARQKHRAVLPTLVVVVVALVTPVVTPAMAATVDQESLSFDMHSLQSQHLTLRLHLTMAHHQLTTSPLIAH